MNIPDDLKVDIRGGYLTLTCGMKHVQLALGGRYGVFCRGPVAWRELHMAYLWPALAQFAAQQSEDGANA
jgi:hypothetical protein